MFKLYNFFSYILIPIVLLNLFLRILKNKEDRIRFKERFGHSTIVKPKKAIIWIPGYNDYFYHYHISEKMKDIDFFAINLRNCGYSKEENCIPHYCNNLEEYFEEIDFLFEEFIKKRNMKK